MNNNNIEIERKFRVKGDFMPFVSKSYAIKQGYLCSDKKRTVRIRIKGNKGFITIKGAANEKGFSRFEWEKEIEASDAEQLLLLCDDGIIDKIRYEVPSDGKIFEIDVFRGVNEGLVLAELELESESEAFSSPDWLGEEVTTDVRFYNSYISKHPYSTWKGR